MCWLLLIGGCAPTSKEAPGEPSVRLVSLAPSLTDMLHQLGAGQLLVGVSRFCRPAPSIRAKVVGSMMDVQTEELVELRPSHLLFVGPATPFEGVSRLAPGTRLERFELEDLNDVRSALRRLSHIAAVPDRGDVVLAELSAKLAQARAQAAGKRPARVIFLLDSNQHGRLVAGPGTYLDDIIAELGLVNAGADVPGQNPWRTADTESVLAARPELLVIKTDDDTAEQADQARGHWTRFLTQSGLSLRRVEVVSDWAWTLPSARLGDVALSLAGFLEPRLEAPP